MLHVKHCSMSNGLLMGKGLEGLGNVWFGGGALGIGGGDGGVLGVSCCWRGRDSTTEDGRRAAGVGAVGSVAAPG